MVCVRIYKRLVDNCSARIRLFVVVDLLCQNLIPFLLPLPFFRLGSFEPEGGVLVVDGDAEVAEAAVPRLLRRAHRSAGIPAIDHFTVKRTRPRLTRVLSMSDCYNY
jgi:hypothetical protein